MELSDVIKEIRRRGVTQEKLAAVLRTRQGRISAMVQGGSTWEKHYRVFLRLDRLCQKLGIDPAHDLDCPSAEEVIISEEHHGETSREDAGRGETSAEAPGTGAISKSGVKGPGRKQR